MRRHAGFERRRRYVLKEPSVFDAPEISCVGADEEVSFGLRTLGADALKQLLGAARERAYAHAGRFLERRVELAVGVIVTGRVDVDVIGVAPAAAVLAARGKSGG